MASKRKRPTEARDDDASAAFSAASVRSHKGWTPDHFTMAERQVAYGDHYLAAAICEWLLSDDRVSGALESRLSALFGLVPTFEPSGDRRRSARAVKALEVEEDWWQSYTTEQLTLIHKWGLLLGVAPARHQSVTGPNGRILPRPIFWHPQTLKRDPQTRKWTIRDDRNAEHVVTNEDGEWLMHRPFGPERPAMSGLWRSLARWVLLKHWAVGDSGTAGQKASTAVVTSPEGSTKEQRKELAAALASGADRLAVLAAGYDMKLLELSAQTGQLYAGQVEMANAAIAIRIRGGNLSSEVKQGSRAAAEVQERTGDQANLRVDAEMIATTIHDQSLTWWAEWNFGDPRLAPWPDYPVEPEEDKQSSADTVKTLGEGLQIFDNLGFEIDDKTLVDRFELDFIKGRKSPEQRAKEAAAKQPPPAPGQQQPAGGGQQQQPKAPGKAQRGQLEASSGLVVALASGDTVEAAPGFVEGQLYTDAVVDSATEAGKVELESTITQVAAAVDAATSYEDLRTRLRELYPKLDPTNLSELVYRAMLLGELAGRHAVNRDA